MNKALLSLLTIFSVACSSEQRSALAKRDRAAQYVLEEQMKTYN